MMNQAMEAELKERARAAMWPFKHLLGGSFADAEDTVYNMLHVLTDSARAEGEPPLDGYALAGCADRAGVIVRTFRRGDENKIPLADDWNRFASEVNKLRAGEQAAPGLRESVLETELRTQIFQQCSKITELEKEREAWKLQIVEEVGLLLADYEMECGQTHPGMFKKISALRDREIMAPRAALTAPMPPRDETFICGECLHGVAQHEWESSAASSCLVEGCKCSGYKKAAPAPVKPSERR